MPTFTTSREFFRKTLIVVIASFPLVLANGQVYNDDDSLTSPCLNKTICGPAAAGLLVTADDKPKEQLVVSGLMDVNGLHTFILAAVLVTSMLGNGLVALVLYRKRQLSPSSRLVFSLCGSNFVLSCVVLPFTLASSVVLEWKFGFSWCALTAFLTQFVASASNLTLAAIAVDRYFAIVKPMSYSVTVTSVKSYLILLAIWMVSLLINAPPIFGWPEIVYEASISTCRAHIERQQIYAWVLLLFDFFVPAVIMTTSYGCIFKVARSKYKKIHIGTVSASVRHLEAATATIVSSTRNSADAAALSPSTAVLAKRYLARNYVRKPSWLSIVLQSPVRGFAVISCILGVFYICWVPHIVAVFLTFNHVISVDSVHRQVTFGIAMLCLPCYPLIYGLLNRSIRKDLFTWLKDRKCGQNGGPNVGGIMPPKKHLPRNSSAISSSSANSNVTLGLLDYTPPFTQWQYPSTKLKNTELVNQRKMSEDSGRFSLPPDDTDASSCHSGSPLDSNKDWETRVPRPNSMDVLEEEDLSGLCNVKIQVDLHETIFSNSPDDGVVIDSD